MDIEKRAIKLGVEKYETKGGEKFLIINYWRTTRMINI